MLRISVWKLLLLNILILFLDACFSLHNESKQKLKTNPIAQIAIKELPGTLGMIPVGKEQLYGFKDRDEFQEAKIDEPFDFFSIQNNNLTKSSTVMVPVTVDNEYRALVSIDSVRGSQHIVDFGAEGLAKEIQQLKNENPNYTFEGLLRIYSISADFLILSDKSGNYYFPLTSARTYIISTGITKTEKYYTYNQVLNLIQ
jgi:hypothetical protein